MAWRSAMLGVTCVLGRSALGMTKCKPTYYFRSLIRLPCYMPVGSNHWVPLHYGTYYGIHLIWSPWMYIGWQRRCAVSHLL